MEFAKNKFGIDQLGPKAIAKISGKAWDELRSNFLVVCGMLLDVSQDAFGELTTTYLKFTIGNTHISRVYAAIWIKNSKSFTLGLALPDDCKHPIFTDALKGMTYKGLTKYVTITSMDTIPEQCREWAGIAYKLRLSELEKIESHEKTDHIGQETFMNSETEPTNDGNCTKKPSCNTLLS